MVKKLFGFFTCMSFSIVVHADLASEYTHRQLVNHMSYGIPGCAGHEDLCDHAMRELRLTRDQVREAEYFGNECVTVLYLKLNTGEILRQQYDEGGHFCGVN
ncbi:MAG: hypothetical protein ACXVCY_06365 [Pseudobdellovibrionaceae bacterium]